MKEFESTKVSRESKGLPNHFSEYDAYLLEPVDFVDYEFHIMLKKSIPQEKGSHLLCQLSVGKDLIGSFRLIANNHQVTGFTYKTESISECSLEFIENLCNYVNRVISKHS